jgi:hypothetical protein
MNNAGSTHEGDFHAAQLNTAPRRAKGKRGAALLLAGLALALGACSTPGPGHTYLHSPALGPTIRDIDPVTGRENAAVPAFLDLGDRVLALAYDHQTDHFFLRLHPGNYVRVVDRPARAIKRDFHILDLPPGGHDMALRARDRNFFFTVGDSPALLHTDFDGNPRGRITLQGLAAPAWGVAHDPATNELLILANEISDRVHRFTISGEPLRETVLAAPVQGKSLAYDAVTRTYFASLADGSAIGVFDQEGRLLRRLPRPAAERETFIAVGIRSLVRMF